MRKREFSPTEKKRFKIKSDQRQEILMLLPLFIGFCLFMIYPIFWILRWAWFNYDGYGEPVFIGIDNFIRAFTRDPNFWNSLKNTAVIASCKAIVEIPLAILLAVFLNSKIKGSNVFRVTYFLPTIFSISVVGLMFSVLFSSYNGIVNGALRALNLITKNINFLGRTNTAIFVMILVSLWTTFGMNMIYFLMGLQNIDRSLYECASIDGANKIQQFFHITLPLIAPIMQLVIMLSILNTIRITDLALVLTNGSPGGSTEVVMTYIFKYFFTYGDAQRTTQFGYASALSTITACILGVFTAIYLHASKRMNSITD